MKAEFTGRAIIREYDDILEIKIPSRKEIFKIIFFSLWLTFWLICGIIAVGIIFLDSRIDSFVKIFISLWLIIWAMGAAFVFGILNWFLFGFELIIIKNGNLKILKKI
ncbi:hypothetical protein, partial [Oceanivirga salmonicida]|uniref:hypothetical protein n=1 Tax=Oceanivirga salmonicida TaxID=1769291 RepID=UPI0018CBFECF